MSDTEDFATLFEASLKAKRVERGQTIEGTIVAIGPEVAFIDVGGKGEATIDVAELKDDEGDIEVAVGDRLQAVVVSTAGGLTLSRKLARGAASQRQLEDAFHSGLPVEGKVEKVVKGGYEVRVAGQRAFCPFSQIDTARTDPSQHEGKVYTFRITEYKEGGRNLLSHGALCSRKNSARRLRKSRRRLLLAQSSAGASPQSANSAHSSIWVVASRVCCISPRWDGRASPIPRKCSSLATRSRSRFCRSTKRKGRYRLD